jgi:uncharacterized SAM-binding protein YcdF (DUF218 family)
MGQPPPDYYAYDRREIARAQASAQWASTIRLFLLLAAAAGLIWVLWFAFGLTGLQFGLIALFVIAVIVGVWLLMLSTHGRVADVMTQTTENLVNFQRADDQGEVARAAIAALGKGTQLDGRVLQVASMIGTAKAKGEIAAYQARQTIEAERQQWQQREVLGNYGDSGTARRDDFHFHD